MARPFLTGDQRQAFEVKIKRAALMLFAREGYRATSLRAIARELRCSATALYSYYDSKESLLAALRAEGFIIMRQHLADARTGSATSVDAVRHAILAYLDFAGQQPELFQLMYELDQGEIANDPVVANERRLAFAEAQGITADLLVASGLDGDANLLAHILWISAHGLVTASLARQLDLGFSREALIEPLIQTLLRGALPAGASTNV